MLDDKELSLEEGWAYIEKAYEVVDFVPTTRRW